MYIEKSGMKLMTMVNSESLVEDASRRIEKKKREAKGEREAAFHFFSQEEKKREKDVHRGNWHKPVETLPSSADGQY
ncbi:hypothetical protein Ancab_009298 [Ancistrocladus abbreviatus]